VTTVATPTFLEATLKAATGEKRELVGLAVPYDEETDRRDWLRGTSRMKILKAEVADGAQIFYGHDHLGNGLPIGLITSSEQTEAGLKITARISETPKGDEVLTLCRDGVLTKFSIGFMENTWHVEGEGDAAGSLLVHDLVDVFETSVVPRPQYETAVIESVLNQQHTDRKAQPTMTITLAEAREGLATAEDVTALAESIETIDRKLTTLGDLGAAGDGTRESGFLSYGDFLKAVAGRDETAIEFLGYLATTTDDLGGHVSDAWVGDLLRELEAKRTVISFFGTSPLPAQGMNVEYGLVRPTADTTQVGKQAAQGDTLPYGEIEFDTDTAPVETYGGWTSWAQQVVDRAGPAVVEKFFRALYRRYQQATEAAVRTTAMDAANSVEVGTAEHDLDTPDGWVDYAVDSAAYLDDRGLTLDGFLVAIDRFKALAKMRVGTDGEFFLDRSTGKVNLTGLSADLFNVPVILVPNASAGAVRGASEEAITVWEDGRAPFRLQDNDITKLTEAMSIYGYLAHAVTDEQAITRPNDGV
jgi:HK97 family phage prohead protease